MTALRHHWVLFLLPYAVNAAVGRGPAYHDLPQEPREEPAKVDCLGKETLRALANVGVSGTDVDPELLLEFFSSQPCIALSPLSTSPPDTMSESSSSSPGQRRTLDNAASNAANRRRYCPLPRNPNVSCTSASRLWTSAALGEKTLVTTCAQPMMVGMGWRQPRRGTRAQILGRARTTARA